RCRSGAASVAWGRLAGAPRRTALFRSQPLNEFDFISKSVDNCRGFQAVGIGCNGFGDLHALAFDFFNKSVETFYFESKAVEDGAFIRGRGDRFGAAPPASSGCCKVHGDPLVGGRKERTGDAAVAARVFSCAKRFDVPRASVQCILLVG